MGELIGAIVPRRLVANGLPFGNVKGLSFHGDGMRRREFLAGGLSVATISRVAAQPATALRRFSIFSLSEPAALMHEKKPMFFLDQCFRQD